jgi:hypothetical protein
MESFYFNHANPLHSQPMKDYKTDVEQLIFFRDSDSAYSDQVHAVLYILKGPTTGEAFLSTVKR